MGKIILASSSPRRALILRQHNIEFEVIPSPYKEDHSVTAFSYEFVENLACCKARGVIPLLKEPSLILGADTVVVLDGKILGKPKDYDEAFSMLKSLSGRKHEVVTSIAIIESSVEKEKIRSVTSFVEFENLSDEQIDFYLKEFKPYDKAGSYGIQEMPEGYIKGYEGSFENIVGLCGQTVVEMLGEINAECRG